MAFSLAPYISALETHLQACEAVAASPVTNYSHSYLYKTAKHMRNVMGVLQELPDGVLPELRDFAAEASVYWNETVGEISATKSTNEVVLLAIRNEMKEAQCEDIEDILQLMPDEVDYDNDAAMESIFGQVTVQTEKAIEDAAVSQSKVNRDNTAAWVILGLSAAYLFTR